ncbi:hypothetical protein D9M68_739200 [compost metagenome]
MTDGDIDPVAAQVDETSRGLDADFDVRMQAGEAPQPRHQPGRRKRRNGADGERLARAGGFQGPKRAFNLVESRQQVGMHAGSGLGQRHAAAPPQEQRQAHARFQQPDLLADGARCHTQGRGRALDAAVATDFRESTQGKQWVNRIHDLALLNLSDRSNRFFSRGIAFRILSRKLLQV